MRRSVIKRHLRKLRATGSLSEIARVAVIEFIQDFADDVVIRRIVIRADHKEFPQA